MPREKVEKESEEVKDMSETNRVVDDATRARIVDQLTDLGVPDASLLSDTDLFTKVSNILEETNKKNIELEAAKAFKPLNMYASQAHSDLKNKEFIERLFMLNIPDIYLAAFTDDDARITEDEKLWEIVKHSGISQYDHPQDAFKNKMLKDRAQKALPREYRGR